MILRYMILLCLAPPVAAQDEPAAPAPQWHYGAFADGAYLYDFNSPANHLFRDRGTTAYVDEPVLNMAGAWIRKDASDRSRWGMELTLQGGKDSEAFGFSATAPNLAGATGLRHLGPTDVSYLAPVGKGLTVQAGIFSSLIGYDSLYAKDNLNYTRPWGADYTPYLMLGVNASYPFTAKLTGTLFEVSGYWHLAHANNVPSSGGQAAYKVTDHTTLKETVLYGPHQSDTSLEFWRFLSDSIAEWKTDRFITAFECQVSEEKVVSADHPRAWWISVQMPLHWSPRGPWSVTVRPEIAWDSQGRWTGGPQFIKAVTSTFDYRIPYRSAKAVVRLEHRFDNSHGGGFFNDGYISPGTPGLKPSQHLFIAALILTLEGSHK
jgi:Putative beta-barrel porin-2, OmpL-like. bbp2